MRLIGHVPDESNARTFGNYLYVRGIENQVELQNPEGWAIWVFEEDQLAAAEELLATFRLNPGDPKYRTESKAAAELRAQADKDLAAYQKRVRQRGHLFRPLGTYGFGPLTFVLIALSVAVFLQSRFGENHQAIMSLFIAPFEEEGSSIRWLRGLTEVRHGQIWRLVTPIFIHMSFLHILFNMLWLRDLGSMIEARQSSWRLGLLVLVIAMGSNAAQFFLSGPWFGGMSGVVYGLLGYVWIRGKFDPASGLFVHPTTVMMMLIWFVVCLTGLVGAANTVHAVGLAMGMALGYLTSLGQR